MSPIMMNDFINSCEHLQTIEINGDLAGRKVYHLPSSRFIEAVIKPALFHLAKTASHRKFIFVVGHILCTTIFNPLLDSSYLSDGDCSNRPILLLGSVKNYNTLQQLHFWPGSNKLFNQGHSPQQSKFGLQHDKAGI